MMELEEENSAGVRLFSVYFSICFSNAVICHRHHATHPAMVTRKVGAEAKVPLYFSVKSVHACIPCPI